jgi:hypothetical protein
VAHPDAAGIDIGAKAIWVAVREDCASLDFHAWETP